MNPGMCYEVLRLQSFKYARTDDIVQVSLILLAEDGFYFDHNTGRVLCFSCGYEHLREFSTILQQIVHEPTCRRLELNKSIRNTTFGLTKNVKQLDKLTNGQQNVAQDLSNQDTIEDRLSSNNGAGHDSLNRHSNQLLFNNEQLQNGDTTQGLQNINTVIQAPSTTASQTTTSSQAGTATARGRESEHSTLNISSVSYPHFSTRQARIHTFTNWNPAHSHRPDDFADLGFYFTGNADCVRCFCCGVGLKFWRPTDDIAYQHARLRPTCAFSRLCKGQAYIDMVQQEIRAHQAEPNLDPLHLSETSTQPSEPTPTGTSLRNANESLSNIATAANGQPGPAATTNGDARSTKSTNTNTHTGSTSATNGQINSPFRTNTHTNLAVTTNRQTIGAVPTNIHSSSSAITNALTSPTVSTNGLVTPSATTHERNHSLASSHSTESIDSVSSEESGITLAPYVNGGSVLHATNGNLVDTHQALQPPALTSAPSLREEELRAVEREHLLLTSRTTCRVCQATPVNSIFLPCGHVATCQDCADKVTQCVICGKVIIGTANIYLS